jgi:hypothetical protein
MSYSNYSNLDKYIGCKKSSDDNMIVDESQTKLTEFQRSNQEVSQLLSQEDSAIRKISGLRASIDSLKSGLGKPGSNDAEINNNIKYLEDLIDELIRLGVKEGYLRDDGARNSVYSALSNYNSQYSIVPVTPNKRCSYTVPNYKQIQYDALTHGGLRPTVGHHNIINAYGSNASNCNLSFSENFKKF